jgi:hypothetical protein
VCDLGVRRRSRPFQDRHGIFRWELQDSVVGMGTGFGEDSNFEEEQTQSILC